MGEELLIWVYAIRTLAVKKYKESGTHACTAALYIAYTYSHVWAVVCVGCGTDWSVGIPFFHVSSVYILSWIN